MSTSELAAVLHGLADLLESREDGDEPLARVLAHFASTGGRIERQDDFVQIFLPDVDSYVIFIPASSLSDSTRVARNLLVLSANLHQIMRSRQRGRDATVEDLVRLVSNGSLAKELNEATGFDPELAV